MAKTNYLGALASAAGVLAALGMLVLMLVLVEPAGAAFPGQNGKIAFTSDRAGGNFEIWTFISRDAPLSRLTNNPAGDDGPAWSADGNKIVYESENEIFTMDANGEHKVQVTNNNTGDHQPSYSPDGNKIVYVKIEGSEAGNDWQIYTINTDGGGKVQLTNNQAKKFTPSYSPDGNKIAYSGFDGNDYEIYTINPNGTGGSQQLTNNRTNDISPSYSPDGNKIAYDGSDGNDREIYTMNANGEGTVQVTDNGMRDGYPSYSPDGNKIVYSGHDGKDSEIYTINPDGGGKIQLTNNDANDIDPDWQPLPTNPTPPATDTFVNNNIIRIPADQISGGTSGKASPYPSTISVSGFKNLTDVNVTIRSATHTHPDDLDVLLVGPTGRTAIIWSDAGGTNAITGTTLTLDEDAQVALPDSGRISAQAYKTSNYQVGEDNWPEVTESGNRSLSTFDGTNPTGEWKLYVFDDTQQPDTGDRSGSGVFQGWTLEIRGTR
jgi:Tol biopolymer transport system component/subtilisin-like proprotein convertase family protein